MRGWPEDAKERDVLDWPSAQVSVFCDLATEADFATLAHCIVFAGPGQPLQGSTADRKLDVGFICNLDASNHVEGFVRRRGWSVVLE